MSDPLSQPAPAVSKVHQSGSPNSGSHSAQPSNTASHRATRGFNGTTSYEGNHDSDDGFSHSADEQSTPGAGNPVAAGLTDWLGNKVEQGARVYKQATSRFNLTDDEKKQLKHGMATLEKLAGEDRRWNSNDLANNMQQFQVKPFLKPVAEVGLRKGMEEMTGKPVDKLTPEQKKAAGERWSGLTDEQREARKFDRGGLDQFKDTMDMIKSRAADLGLPEGKFPNGMSVDFMQAILENQPGIVLNFKR